MELPLGRGSGGSAIACCSARGGGAWASFGPLRQRLAAVMGRVWRPGLKAVQKTSSQNKTAEANTSAGDRSGPQDRNVEPMWMEFFFTGSALQDEATLLCSDEMLLDQLETVGVESSLREEARPRLARKST